MCFQKTHVHSSSLFNFPESAIALRLFLQYHSFDGRYPRSTILWLSLPSDDPPLAVALTVVTLSTIAPVAPLIRRSSLRELWTPSCCLITLLPPKQHKQVGRPKKKRNTTSDESSQPIVKGGKMTRVGNTMTCAKCQKKGCNRAELRQAELEFETFQAEPSYFL
ncbi:hypothetical protein E3N88_10497 [Mikania micrantha]|uniref:Uncharacterized protein n=1 Tax=Mikania micrantha TaxID=192012 RepID=A0A5N6PDN5_9ASTR|nr:hypothetical protein E3N88_10497 [Mikania micrantha]